ncbi:MAG: phosphatidylethanolamine N-methyltransferase family protein [Salaquimonas sp.]|nr:phosphatidylethanolamine N-methyltransferase family protein [Salaquimonas sp.]
MGMSRLFFERQWLHALGLIVLLPICAWMTGLDAVRHGSLWGLATINWYWIAIFIPILHQVYVLIVWRSELHGGACTRVFGQAAFPLYCTGFAIIGIARIIVVFLLAWANRGSFEFAPIAMKVLAVIMLIPALYLFYSVRRYFGFERAFGIDHFDASYRDVPFVKRGIFRFTDNGMYIYGFFLLWVPGLWWGSAAALTVAAFNHLYIWVHYYATELPDIRRIYGAK